MSDSLLPAEDSSRTRPTADAAGERRPTDVLVIGGAGFIGSHLVDRLVAERAAVEVVDDLSSGSLANLAGRPGGGAAQRWRAAHPHARRDVAGPRHADHVAAATARRPPRPARARRRRPPSSSDGRSRRCSACSTPLAPRRSRRSSCCSRRRCCTAPRRHASSRSRRARSRHVECAASSPRRSSSC